ncbi:MAG: hypothetical protein ACPGUD_12360 [Parashewanella sp.]
MMAMVDCGVKGNICTVTFSVSFDLTNETALSYQSFSVDDKQWQMKLEFSASETSPSEKVKQFLEKNSQLPASTIKSSIRQCSPAILRTLISSKPKQFGALVSFLTTKKMLTEPESSQLTPGTVVSNMEKAPSTLMATMNRKWDNDQALAIFLSGLNDSGVASFVETAEKIVDVVQQPAKPSL